MSWTEPPTFVSDTVLTAADQNILSEDLRVLKAAIDGLTFVGVDLSRSASQSIADATDVDITWQVQNFDYGSWWSTGTTITVPSAAIPDGYSTIACDVYSTIRFVPDGSSGRQLSILVNGTVVAQSNFRVSESDYVTVQLAQVIIVAAADAITVQARQNSGANLDMDSARVQIIRRAPVA